MVQNNGLPEYTEIWDGIRIDLKIFRKTNCLAALIWQHLSGSTYLANRQLTWIVTTQPGPHPKSLSLGERDFNLAPLLPREKGLGDEGQLRSGGRLSSHPGL
jgi:hypothetical protein